MVLYIPLNEKTMETDIKPKKIKGNSLPRKQIIKIFHKTKNNSSKIFQLKYSNILNEKRIVIFNKKKHTDTLIEQTLSQPQETLEFKIINRCILFHLIHQ